MEVGVNNSAPPLLCCSSSSSQTKQYRNITLIQMHTMCNWCIMMHCDLSDLLQLKPGLKVKYPKYSKHWLSTVAHTIDYVCSKILNHEFIFSLFKFFGWKNILNWHENSGLKSRFLFCLIFQFYLMYRLICQKPAHFCCPNGFGEHLFSNVYSTWDV